MKKIACFLFVVFFTLAEPALISSASAQEQGAESDAATGNEGDLIVCKRQHGNPNIVLCPQGREGQGSTPGTNTSGQVNGFAWLVFDGVWTLALICLFMLFRWNRNKKLLVKIPDKEKKGGEDGKDKEPPEPMVTKKAVTLALIFSLVLGVSLLVLLSSGSWTELFVLLGAWATIVFAHWPQTAEIWKAVKTLRQSGSAKPVVLEEKITFKDVGGLDEVIQELEEVVHLYKDVKEAESWDIRLPGGILLIGPAGCGKTLLAKAIAGAAGLKFFAYSAAEIGSSYVRSGAQDIKYAFTNAVAEAPCVLFFDEIDALGRKRGYDTSGEFDHALTELLHEMDGVRGHRGVLMLAATNREDVIDEALLRPGRFDIKIVIPHPDVNGREHILKIHTAKKRLHADVNLRNFAERTPGFSGAALEQITNEAARLARRRYEDEKKRRGALSVAVDAAKEFFLDPERVITIADFEEAILRVQVGPAKKLVMSENEQRIVAWHEIGHAIVTAEKGLEILDKVTLMPRNWALGMTESHSSENYLPSKPMLMAKIASLLGGRAAEEIFLSKDKVTAGGGNDFEKAHELARKMVAEWGMGELGPAVFHKLTPGLPGEHSVSEHTAQKIDQEVERLITASLADARKIIGDKKETANSLAEMLIEKGVLHAAEITSVLKAAA